MFDCDFASLFRFFQLFARAGLCFLLFNSLHAEPPRPPNILIVLTDDQGYGDLGRHGNPHLKTPALDAFAEASSRFTRFYVSPVCSPTRASLMTGRYNYRTGVIDTYFGRSTMAPEEFTLAEALSKAGYATGLFGKWHLGDNYPYRPQEQGFEEVLMHAGGGIGQPSDPPGGNRYFDPILLHNGQEQKYPGYCMDVFTDKALAFMEKNKDRPFFILLATNTPHTPLQVPEKYVAPYLQAGLPVETAKVYGMVANIDENFGRLLAGLDEMALAENTIVIFLNDNGPEVLGAKRHRAGLRGDKTEVYEGGIRTPFFLRWPAGIGKPVEIDAIAAHIDLMPTLLELSGVPAGPGHFDGRSLKPLLDGSADGWQERTLFFQWHRGNAPDKYRNFAAVEQRYKLLQLRNKFDEKAAPEFELYDLLDDPGEGENIATEHPQVVERLRTAYERWFADVSSDRGYPEFPAWIGSNKENPVFLTQQDRRDADSWENDKYQPAAYWPVRIMEDGKFEVTLELLNPMPEDGTAMVRVGDKTFSEPAGKGTRRVVLPTMALEAGEARLVSWIEFGDKRISPYSIWVKRVEMEKR